MTLLQLICDHIFGILGVILACKDIVKSLVYWRLHPSFNGCGNPVFVDGTNSSSGFCCMVGLTQGICSRGKHESPRL
jgi:hypothetical protein